MAARPEFVTAFDRSLTGSTTGMLLKVSVDGRKSTHAWLPAARRSPPAEEAAGAAFPRVRAHPVAMANSGLPREERGHQSKGTRGTARHRTDHAWPHRRQAGDVEVDQEESASDRPAQMASPSDAGRAQQTGAGR